MAYPFEKMTTRKLRSKLYGNRKRDRSHDDRSDPIEANPLNINPRRSNPTHCKIEENQSSR